MTLNVPTEIRWSLNNTNKQTQSVHNFLSNVHTDKQTNQRYQKHNLLCQGGNK